ncbi:hypothetical protein WAI453_002545 [Rhynchosporium graminicola]
MEGLVSTIERYKIAEGQVVPPITIRLVNNPIVQAYDLSCNKRIASSAAPIMLHRGGGLKQAYGMTKRTGLSLLIQLDKHASRCARTSIIFGFKYGSQGG